MQNFIKKITKAGLAHYILELLYGDTDKVDPDKAFAELANATADQVDVIFAIPKRDNAPEAEEIDKANADKGWRNYMQRGTDSFVGTMQKRIKSGRRK